MRPSVAEMNLDKPCNSRVYRIEGAKVDPSWTERIDSAPLPARRAEQRQGALICEVVQKCGCRRTAKADAPFGIDGETCLTAPIENACKATARFEVIDRSSRGAE
jgi:hypothetical protein